jgi:hypothetical protein
VGILFLKGVSFCWCIKGGDLRVNTKEGGVLVGKIGVSRLPKRANPKLGLVTACIWPAQYGQKVEQLQMLAEKFKFI